MDALLENHGFLIVMVTLQSLLALSLYVPFSTGQLSLASPGFYALGGYVAAVLSTRFLPLSEDGSASLWGLVLEMGVAALLAGALALAIGLPTLRLRGVYFALATLAFVEVTRIVSQNLEITGGAIGIFAIPQVFPSQGAYLLISASLLVIVFLALMVFFRTKTGWRFRALREDELAAQSLGINPMTHRLLAFVMSAVLASWAGVIAAHVLNTWNARQGTFDLGVSLLAAVLLGGSGTLWGPFIGAAFLTLLPEVLRDLQDYRYLVNGILLVLVAIYFPEGLVKPVLEKIAFFRKTEKARSSTLPRDWHASGMKPSESSSGSESVFSEHVLSSIEGLSRSFGGVKAVQDVSFAINRHEIFGVIGPNGAGKTTLFNLLSGMDSPTCGKILLAGKDLTGAPAHAFARQGVARTFQNIRLFSRFSVFENVFVASCARDVSLKAAQADVLRYLELVGLEGKANRMASTLSYGDQRRLEIARALALEPRILFLDEPTAGMNAVEKETVATLIRRLKEELRLTVVLIDHHVPLMMSLCHRIAVLEFGRLIALGGADEIKNDRRVIEAYLGGDSK